MGQEKLSVAVVGLGNVGYEVAKFIAMADFPKDAKYSLGELILLSGNREKAQIGRQTINGIKSENMKGMSVTCGHSSTLQDFSPSIVINCASVPEAKKYSDRRQMGTLNLELATSISSQIPDDALEIIVTNHILNLCHNSVKRCKRDPQLVIGCAHVDSLRAGIAIEESLGSAIKGSVDKSNIFIIGSHDDNEMVLAYKTATVNSIALEELKSVAGQMINIEKFASEFAHMQIMARKTTNELTAKAVLETLRAVLTEKSHVSAGVLCNFADPFFRNDPDYFKFDKPDGPVYMVMRAGFQNLRAGLAAGMDPNPDGAWFVSQAAETKEAFYRVAMKQRGYLRIKKLI